MLAYFLYESVRHSVSFKKRFYISAQRIFLSHFIVLVRSVFVCLCVSTYLAVLYFY